VVKYDTAGNLLWVKQFGTSARDSANDIFGDNQGNIYLAGNTRGSWTAPNAGGADFVLIKLTPPAAASVNAAALTSSADNSSSSTAIVASSTSISSPVSKPIGSNTANKTTTSAADKSQASSLLLAAEPTRQLPSMVVDSVLANFDDDGSTGWNDSLDDKLLLALATAPSLQVAL